LPHGAKDVRRQQVTTSIQQRACVERIEHDSYADACAPASRARRGIWATFTLRNEAAV
jgi:hypothetical protein